MNHGYYGVSAEGFINLPMTKDEGHIFPLIAMVYIILKGGRHAKKVFLIHASNG